MTNRSRLDHVQKSLSWGLLGLLSWAMAILLVLWLSSFVNYGYSVWYQALSIDRHIARYAPANLHKPGFASLPASTHRQLFADIVSAVHGRGGELADIRYPFAGRSIPLLNRDEVNHLLDVKRLIGVAEKTFLVLLVVVSLLWLYCRRRPVSIRHFMLANLVLVVLCVLLVLALGPKAVFYRLHEWIFPPQHPWFFYWEESLMSTLMKAPYLFGAIAVQTLLLALPLWWLAMATLLRRFRPLAGG